MIARWPNHGQKCAGEFGKKLYCSDTGTALSSTSSFLLYAARKTSIMAGATLPLCHQEGKEQRVTEKSVLLFLSHRSNALNYLHLYCVFSGETAALVAIETPIYLLLLTVTPLTSITTNRYFVVSSPWSVS